MGVGALRQDPTLDAAAENHLGYMQANGIVAHTEVRGAKGYTHDDPYQQVIAAGGSNKQWVGQMAYRGEMGACLRSLANSIYHLQGITGNQETVGIAMRDDYCVANFAVVTAITDGGYGLAQWGGQQLATSASAYFPSDSAVVPGTFVPGNEIPNPAPDLETAGPPIMFRVNVETAADVLTVETFELRDRRDEPVPARILVSSDSKPGSAVVATEDARIFRGVAFLLPTKPVPAGTYTASFIGARNGVPIAKSWSFSAY
ncbi:hypothetical protein LMG26411_04953 [Cupriavidus numazuensis]|uniref:SCP domain-containing protein n=2 Tax=Cupriavidus numazuensis TaxID=221992 RepID=A0ABN7Q399_9BURK|nr:hypothetical protein LMG26411_04953 [Cupriavidus numazuensis]